MYTGSELMTPLLSRDELTGITKMPSDPHQVSYRIVFEKDGIAPAAGVVRSTSLSVDLHGEHAVGVLFGDCSEETRNGHVVLDSFQLDSLNDYLRSQPRVLAAIENSMRKHPDDWRLIPPAQKNIWKHVQVYTVILEPKSLPPESKRSRQVRVVAAGQWDSPQTRSKYRLMLSGRQGSVRGRPWSDEHDRICLFRDGELVEVEFEG